MLREIGEQILNLEMPDRVYRTEYSVVMHTELIKKVTGAKDPTSPEAKKEFFKVWDICSNTATGINSAYLGKFKSNMGHAEYQNNGVDKDDNVFNLFEDPEDILDFRPEIELPRSSNSELIERFNLQYQKQLDNFDTATSVGTYITLMSGMIEMLGWDSLLMAAGMDLEAFGELLNRYTDWMMHVYTALADCDVPYIKMHDDIVWTEGAFIAPEWYRKYIFPNYKKLLAPIKEAGKKIIYVCDGNYNQFIDDIADCGVDCFMMEPDTDMKYIAEKYGKTHSFVGNADTRILLRGTKEDIYNEVKRCMDIGKKCPGFVMAVGNHIPPNTPIDSCLYYDEFCKTLGRR